MNVRKRTMSISPIQGRGERKQILPLHEISPRQAEVKAPLPMKLDDDENSDSSGSWRSQQQRTGEMLPIWSANPQSPSDESVSITIEQKSDSFSTSPSEKRPISPLLVLGFVLMAFAAVFTSRTTLINAGRQLGVLEHSKNEMSATLIKVENDVRSLQREISAMDMMIEKQQEVDFKAYGTDAASVRAAKELSTLQERLKDESLIANKLKDSVRISSLFQIKEKYGSGVHRVEIELVFPDGRVGPTTFQIELAPNAIMPHSVFTFLEMVSTGLLDGCSFILNALHVLKAAPLPYDGTSAAEKAKAFTAHGLESVAFKEYDDSYPHKQYTVGFAADGSPSFYINTEDNTEIHVGDPCFGKVIAGFDTIRRLEASPTRNGIWFKHRIGIRKARILS